MFISFLPMVFAKGKRIRRTNALTFKTLPTVSRQCSVVPWREWLCCVYSEATYLQTLSYSVLIVTPSLKPVSYDLKSPVAVSNYNY